MTLSNGSLEQTDPMTLIATLADNLQRHRLLPESASTPPQPLVIGVSGGADSVALLHAMVSLAEKLNVRVHVAHIDHGLRPESSVEANFVRRLCVHLGCDFHHHALEPEWLHNRSGSIEALARFARYAFLCQVANNVAGPGQVPVLATAHHADDQAETLLLHLVRGSGLRGLGGMRWKREVTRAEYELQTKNLSANPVAVPISTLENQIGAENLETNTQSGRTIWLIRPMLNLRRSAIRTYLDRHELAWCEDASNDDPAYTRNYLRHNVLPGLAQINPKVVDALFRTTEIVARDMERLEILDRRQLANLLIEPASLPKGRSNHARLILDLQRLLALPRPDQRGVLRVALYTLTGPVEAPGFEAIERLLDRLPVLKGNSGPHTLNGTVVWTLLEALPEQQARLSLHRADELPVSTRDGPQLGADWRPTWLNAGQETITGGWRLSVSSVGIDELPEAWMQTSRWEAWLDAEKIGAAALATPSRGMCIEPLGMAGQRKSLGNLFTDAKVHPTLRPGWPIIVDTTTDTVIWVCGQRIAHGAQITTTTRRVLHLAWMQQREARLGANH
jgi:tRNA(Ile)-lysidine synthase